METVMSNEAVAVLSPESGYGFYLDKPVTVPAGEVWKS